MRAPTAKLDFEVLARNVEFCVYPSEDTFPLELFPASSPAYADFATDKLQISKLKENRYGALRGRQSQRDRAPRSEHPQEPLAGSHYHRAAAGHRNCHRVQRPRAESGTATHGTGGSREQC